MFIYLWIYLSFKEVYPKAFAKLQVLQFNVRIRIFFYMYSYILYYLFIKPLFYVMSFRKIVGQSFFTDIFCNFIIFLSKNRKNTVFDLDIFFLFNIKTKTQWLSKLIKVPSLFPFFSRLLPLVYLYKQIEEKEEMKETLKENFEDVFSLDNKQGRFIQVFFQKIIIPDFWQHEMQ